MKHINTMFELNGKKAIVTGGARGLCYSIAEGLHDAGAEIVLIDINRENLVNAAEALGKEGPKVHYVVGDLSKLDELHSVYQEALEKLGGRVDILLNGAGLQYRSGTAGRPYNVEAGQRQDY